MNELKNLEKGINRKKADYFVFALCCGYSITWYKFTVEDFTTICKNAYYIEEKSKNRIANFNEPPKHYRFGKKSLRIAIETMLPKTEISYRIKDLTIKDYRPLLEEYSKKYDCVFRLKSKKADNTYYTIGDFIEMVYYEKYTDLEWKKSNDKRYDVKNIYGENIEIKSFIENSFEISPCINQWI